jgi:ribonucleoside-diphosphate reductase alpha chain
MPLTNVIKLVSSLQLENENINTWANGVARALKKYTTGEEDLTDDFTSKDE